EEVGRRLAQGDDGGRGRGGRVRRGGPPRGGGPPPGGGRRPGGGEGGPPPGRGGGGGWGGGDGAFFCGGRVAARWRGGGASGGAQAERLRGLQPPVLGEAARDGEAALQVVAQGAALAGLGAGRLALLQDALDAGGEAQAQRQPDGVLAAPGASVGAGAVPGVG